MQERLEEPARVDAAAESKQAQDGTGKEREKVEDAGQDKKKTMQGSINLFHDLGLLQRIVAY